MNIVSAITAQFALIRAALFSRVGTFQDLETDARSLKVRVAALIERNNDEANDLENEIASLNDDIVRLDDETAKAENILEGLSRLLGDR